MALDVKSILKDTSIYALGDILAKGVGFFAIIFYTHFLSQEDMGVYGYILVLVGFVNTFLILGADNAYARYFFVFKTHHQRQILTTTLFVWFVVWFTLIVIPPILYSDMISKLFLKTESYSAAFLTAFLSLPLRLFSSMSNQALRNQFKTKQFITYNFITALVTVFGTIGLLSYTSMGISSIFLGMIIADILVLPLRLYSIRELFVFEMDLSIIRQVLSFGIPFVPASIAYWIFSSADRIMLEKMSGLTNVGNYTVAVSLSVVMSLLVGAIGQAWSPHALNAYEENQEHAKVLYIRFLNILISIAIFVIFCAALIGKEIIGIFFPPEYSNIFYPLVFLLIGLGFQITTQVTASGISISKKTIYLVYITLTAAIINIGLNYLLIPYFQELGAAIATSISYVSLTFMYAFVSQKLFKLKYDLKFVYLGFIFLFLILIASFLPLWIRIFILVSTLYTVYLNKSKILEAVK